MAHAGLLKQAPPDAVQSRDILDAQVEAGTARLVRLLARICETPIAVLTLVDGLQQKIDSAVGLELSEIEQAISFCTHTLRGKHLFLIPDARKIALFAGDPMVTGVKGIRFYAGLPLISPAGVPLGTLAVMDRVPRTLTEEQGEALETLAEQMMVQIALRRQRSELERLTDEHRQAQEAIRESEERFKTVAKATTDAVWDWDLKSDCIWWSEGIHTLFGVPPEDIEPGTVSWTGRIHPEDCKRVLDGIHQIIDGRGENWVDEYRFRCRDGSYAYVLDRGFVIRTPDGKAVRMVGGMSDLTVRKQAEQEACHATETQAGIVQAQKEIASANLDLQAVMNLMTERARALTGATFGAIELVEGPDVVCRAAAGLAATHIGTRMTLAGSLSGVAVRDLTALYCEDTESDDRVDRAAALATGIRSIIAAPLRAADKAIGVLKVMSDRPGAFTRPDVSNLQILVESLGAVIERHRTAERLRASEEQYRLLFDQNPQPMWVYETATLRVLAVNRAAIKHYGYTEDEFLALTIRALRPEADIPALKQKIRTIGPESFGVWRHRKKDGSIISVEVSSHPIDFNGHSARMALTNDVTQRLAAERDLARVSRAQRMLSACNEALIRAENESSLLKEICRVAVEIGGYRVAWVGFAQDDTAKSIIPVANFGNDPGYMRELRLSWSEAVPIGRGPAGRAVRTGEVVVVPDLSVDVEYEPWRTLSSERGFRGGVCLPLRNRASTFGVLSLYAAEVANFSADEVKLLQALADDLTFGINNLRLQDEQRRLQLAAVKLAAGVSASTGTEFFEQLVRNMVEAVGAQAGILARLLPDQPTTARTIAVVVDGAARENFDYPIDGSPCQRLFTADDLVVPENVAALFPHALPLTILGAPGAQGFIGRRLDNSAGQPVGLLFVLFREPLERSDLATSTLQIFAARAAAELERQVADARIREQASLLDKAKDAIVVHGIDNQVHFWNKGAERLYGWTPDEAIGESIEKLLYEDPSALRDAIRSVMEHGEWSGEITERRKDGTALTVEAHWTLVLDENSQPQSIFAIKSDITQRKAAEHEIQHLAFYDPLTRLPNRLLLMERLENALAVSDDAYREGALLFIDLDNFKTLNDTLGHDKGDLLLQQVAVRLTTCVSDCDTVARLGGDEFVVMLQDLSGDLEEAAAQARTVGEKILAALNQPFRFAAYEHHSTPSIGITLFTDHQFNVRELLKRADLAMYQAKAAGRNTLRFFDPGMQTALTDRAAMEADLRQGLQRNEFLVYYQPQVDSNGRVAGAEALVRWLQPQRGLVSPAEFIPLAEDTGLILQIGHKVLETACAQLAAWAKQARTAQLTLAVNVSARQFRHPEFVDQVLAVLAQSGANPHKLKLELTESLLVDNVEDTIAKMTALQARGVGFSLDDFGTGYSSLSYLKRLPLDQLKIDQSFVRDVLNDPNDAVIARTIVALGQSLGLAVIAEGVETEAQRDFLARNGCHAYQGYLFSPPLPIDRFEKFMDDTALSGWPE
ncbi:MAG: hypothetical protein JWQ23_3554 [Herminiimonas sp.]|nr:hypothetical protein [Herminiimonas sp.]